MDRLACLCSQARAAVATACGNHGDMPRPLTAPMVQQRLSPFWLKAQVPGTPCEEKQPATSALTRYPARPVHGPRWFWPSTRPFFGRASGGRLGPLSLPVTGLALQALARPASGPPASLEAPANRRGARTLGVVRARVEPLGVGRTRTPEWRTPMTTPLCHSWDMM